MPKKLEENGFTAEVASQRLRDAVNSYVKTVKTHMKNPNIQLHGEEPNIVVPAVGLSLDAIIAMLRTFVYSDYRKNISGDLIISESKLWLRLRLNGNQFYSSLEGDNPDHPDKLFEDAARDVVGKTYPYIVASDMYYKDPSKALEMAQKFIADFPAWDENVPWLYRLEGIFYLDRRQYVEATAAVTRAIELNGKFAAAHDILGAIFLDQHLTERAKNEFLLAISIDQNDVDAHMSLGEIMNDEGKTEEAIMEFRKVIKIEPNLAHAHGVLGNLLMAAGKNDEATTEFQTAISATSRMNRNDAGQPNDDPSTLLCLRNMD